MYARQGILQGIFILQKQIMFAQNKLNQQFVGNVEGFREANLIAAISADAKLVTAGAQARSG